MTSTSSHRALPATRDHWFYAVSAAVFTGCAAATIALCLPMSGGMDMPGGWTMSMAWMKMPGDSWASATLMFMQMWLVMMVAMMMPSLVPMLARYRRALRQRDAPHVGMSTVLALVAYFMVWQAVGAIAYVLGVAFAAAAMHWTSLSKAVPALTGASLLLCGIIQLSRWKMTRLRRCRDPQACGIQRMYDGFTDAWKHGLDFGTCCASCCSGFVLALLNLGAMSLVVMAVITVAITVERLLPTPDVAVRLSGAAMLALGATSIGRLLVS